MKRKVIRQGNGTLTVTLPKRWTEEVGLSGSDEVDVSARGRDIVVSFSNREDIKRIKVDTTRIKDTKTLLLLLSGLHKSGYDEIEMIYSNAMALKAAQKQISDLFTGFAIMGQSNKRIVLKRISKEMYSEMESSLRRAFTVTIALGDAILERLESRNLGNMSELISLEKTNNQLTNFCERLIVKIGYDQPNKICFKYLMAWAIEKVCDCFKDLCMYIDETGLKSVSKEYIGLYKDVLGVLRKLNSAVFRFDMEKFEDLLLEGRKARKKIDNIVPKKGYEHKLLYILESTLERVNNFSGSLVALNL